MCVCVLNTVKTSITATASQVFDISTHTGLITLTSNTSLLRHIRVNVTVQATITDNTGDTLTSDTLLSCEFVDAEWSVGGLAWECLHDHVTVTENTARELATLRAYNTHMSSLSDDLPSANHPVLYCRRRITARLYSLE